MFDYLDYKNKFPLHLFSVGEIPKLNPLSSKFTAYWKPEKRRCIEGNWVEYQGEWKWVPGSLHFYINHWHILLNKKGAKSKTKSVGKPLLRDLEWIKNYVYATARGFSGFELDDKFTCHRVFETKGNLVELDLQIQLLEDHIRESLYDFSGKLKTYKPALEYLYQYFDRNLGKPLYHNMALNIVDIESRGCLAEGTEVLMFDGAKKKVEDIREGDKLMGKDGTVRTVQWLHSGTSPMYRIKSTKYADIVVNENHNLSVKYTKFNRKGNEEIQTHFKIKDLLDKQSQVSFRNRYYRYLGEAIPFQEKELPIDPYYLGLWLADGRSNCTSIKTTDKVLLDYLGEFADKHNIEYKLSVTEAFEKCKEAYEIYFKDPQFRECFKSLGLINNKHIPEIYKTSSIDQRQQFLAGLIDGDGCFDKLHGSYDIYCGISENIADDVVYIARSLGLYANKNIRERGYYQTTYEVLISGKVDKIPCKLTRKIAKISEKRIDVTKSSFHIQYEGIGKFYGFHVDKDNEYLLGDFTVDHNTGKSFTMSSLCAHNFLLDGAMDYDEYLERRNSNEPLTSETLVGAIDTKYSNDLIKKIKLGLDFLEGGVTIGKINYPPPLSKEYSGSWESGKTVIQEYEKKINGEWQKFGTKSKLQHRTFSDNPFAANGTRPGFSVIDEVGFMGNLEKALGQMAECTADGAFKFGTIWMCVCEGTKVWTKDGRLVNIEDLTIEDGIIGWDESTKQTSPTSIIRMFPVIEKPTLRLTTNTGRILECSTDHPILWSNANYGSRTRSKDNPCNRKFIKKTKFKEAKDILVGDQIATAEQINVFGNNTIWEPRLIGMLIGDGSYGFDKTPILSNCDKEINVYIDTRFNTKVEKSYITKDGRVYRETRIREICPKLRELGIYGQTKLKKTLPPSIHSANRETVVELLAGLYDTDGHVCIDKNNQAQIGLTSSSKNLLEEIRLLLQKLGIHGSIQTIQPRKENRIDKNVYYKLIIVDQRSLLLFQESISLLVKYKQHNLNRIKEIYINRPFRKSSNIEGLRFERIISVEDTGIRKVYNLTAAGHNTYMANGIVTHNCGTGGDMAGGATHAVKSVFYDPAANACIQFDDIFEKSGKKIGFFIPAWMGLNQFKDELGNTLRDRALAFLEAARAVKKLAKSKKPYEDELQQRPIKPSEAFLVSTGNVFPAGDLMEQLNFVESSTDAEIKGVIGTLVLETNGKVNFKPDLTNTLRQVDFPTPNDDTQGGVVIYHHPIENMGGLYLAGNDPYAQAETNSSPSVGATYVMMRATPGICSRDTIVAEYVGRPGSVKEHNEVVRRLALYYGIIGTLLYENNVNNLKDYFETKNSLHLLAKSPDVLKSTVAKHLTTQYGIRMSAKQIKDELELYLRDWLLEEVEEGRCNLHFIYSAPLLRELIEYNNEGNFDRAIALMVCICQKIQMHRIIAQKKQELLVDDFFTRKHFTNKS